MQFIAFNSFNSFLFLSRYCILIKIGDKYTGQTSEHLPQPMHSKELKLLFDNLLIIIAFVDLVIQILSNDIDLPVNNPPTVKDLYKILLLIPPKKFKTSLKTSC